MNFFKYHTLQEGWEQIQEYIVNHEVPIRKQLGGYLYGSMLSLYDIVMEVDECWVDPEFDFGKVLGYTEKKWTKLIKNYVNRDYLDLIKSEITDKIKRGKTRQYAYAFHFDNKFGSGKDCLISMIFENRRSEPIPVITFHTRASEITKRMIFDFLLIQRIAEYIYGPKQKCKAIINVSFSFVNLDDYMMYVAWRGLKVLKSNGTGKYSYFQERCFRRFEEFKKTPLEKITYKVSSRAAAQVKMWKGDMPHIPTLYAKQLQLFQLKPKKTHLKIKNKINEEYDSKG